MEAILEMSLLTNAKKWEQSYLPSKEQMRLHVDEEEFLRHLMHDTFFSDVGTQFGRGVLKRCFDWADNLVQGLR